MVSGRLHFFARLVGVATFLLIIAGGLVTSTGSGLSVPDWPLSYGQVFPPMIGGIRFEHSHRVIAGSVALLTLALAVWICRRDERRAVRRLALAAVGTVVLQAVLGGLTVIYLLPAPISIAHACLGQTFFCILVALAACTSPAWLDLQPRAAATARPLTGLAVLATGFVYLQLVLGATVRHTHGQHGIVPHVLGAALAFIHVLLLARRAAFDFSEEKRLSRPALFAGLLVIVQVFLGIGAFVTKYRLDPLPQPRLIEVVFATAHQATGALILAACFLTALWSFRLFRKPAGDSSAAFPKGDCCDKISAQ